VSAAVAATFAELPRRFRGLRALTGTLEPAELPDPLVVEYDVAGPGGGWWHVIADATGCSVNAGRATDPRIGVRVLADDWLDLHAGRVSVWTLIRSGRLTFSPEHGEAADLPYLGLLGAPVEPPRDAPWLMLHRLERARRGSFVAGARPDFDLYGCWRSTVMLTPNGRLIAILSALAWAITIWWVRGPGLAGLGVAAVTMLVLVVVALGLIRPANLDRRVFTVALMSGLLTVRPRARS
jgi:hypothetical protein